MRVCLRGHGCCQVMAKTLLRNIAMFAIISGSSLSGCARENSQPGHFVLQPLGNVDEKLLALMRRFAEAAYNRPCKVAKPQELPSSAYDTRRKQYRAGELLSLLKDLAPTGAAKVVGITEKDIFTRQMNFIFGLADVRGKPCVVSTCRLHQSFWGEPENDVLLYRRALKILYHELGHTFGMDHCDKIRCAMCYHNSLPELDVSYICFCPSCTRKLEKLVGRFPDDRDAKLAALLTEVGLPEDAKLYIERKEGSE